MALRFQDRIVQYPNRVKLTPVAGQANVYDVSRVEGTVTAQGTALNRENLEAGFLSLATGGEVAYSNGYGVYIFPTGVSGHAGSSWLWRLDENGIAIRDRIKLSYAYDGYDSFNITGPTSNFGVTFTPQFGNKSNGNFGRLLLKIAGKCQHRV